MNHLSGVGTPHFIIRTTPRERIASVEYSVYPDALVRKLRGRKVMSFDGLMNEFGAAFQFFDDFGENWHALEELLCYMDEWLPAAGYVVVVTCAEHLLEEEPEQFESFMRVLNDVADWWSHPVRNNGRFDRPSRPFKVVLEVEGAKAMKMARRIRAIGAQVMMWGESENPV